MTKINIEEIIIEKTENTNNTNNTNNIDSDESISDSDTDESDYTSIDESEYIIDDLEKDNIIKKVNILENMIDNVLDKDKNKKGNINEVNILETIVDNVFVLDKDKNKADNENEKVIKNVIKDIIEDVEKVDNIKLVNDVEKVEKSTMTRTSYSNIKKGNNLNIQRNNLNNTKQCSKPYSQYKPYCPKCKIHGHNRRNCPEYKDEKKHIYEMDIESITNKLGVNEIKLQKNMKAMQEIKAEYIKLTNEKTLLINDHDKLEKMLLEKKRINDLYCEENINLTKVAYANFYKINVNDITLEEIISSSAGFKGWFETTKSCRTKNNL